MAPLTPDEADQRFLRGLVFVILVLASTYFLYCAGDLLLSVFGAILGAIFLRTLADWLVEHARLPRGLGLVVNAQLPALVVGFLRSRDE